ncbi:TIGR00730 family Rossman fold protein [Corynebacterium sp. TAE3-ERU12]|uniref:TIGR00730 family Rossman fold protein n=1 Tax=Corynebacterium sp. TAE3-ERU12 TaxID=2849491 RepID=UPI001C48CBFA|nr:TIGR00730 family Rossman fold protein [Corynebacterium sp. TAE3-ERU12]MBV7294408.1 TIGR00730 family Rossman fold protein [Corynebacterium sp. TAE3-ERU12]
MGIVDSPVSPQPPIEVAACVLTRPDGRVLTVRKRGTRMFMLPGGKPEPGETPVDTCIRELSEELGVHLAAADLVDWGTASDTAANEPGRRVVGHHLRYTGDTPEVTAQAEIEELRWVDPYVPAGNLAPMLLNHTLPRLREHTPARNISAVTVFAGANAGTDPAWAAAAAACGEVLARHGVEVVYGGGSSGLMGAVADAALAAGGEVTGVMPALLFSRELAHQGLTRFEQVGTMPQRKERMYALGDAFVALPGGAGTLEELFEVWTRQHIGIHQQPVVLMGPSEFWEPLLTFLYRLADAGMIHRRHVDALVCVSDPEQLLPTLTLWQAPGNRWADR